MKAIESDTKLHQYAIEKGFGLQETSYNLAITDSQHTCNFIVPEPLHQQRAISHTVIQASDNIATAAAIQQEYLRHFETPQSMSSTREQRPTSQNDKLTAILSSSASTGPQQPFRCMPMQIKVEPHDDYLGSSEVSPAASDEHLQTVSDASSIRSNENLSGSSMVCVNKKTSNQIKSSDNSSSDKSFVNAYISSSMSGTTASDTTKSSSDKSSVKTSSPDDKQKPSKKEKETVRTNKRPLRSNSDHKDDKTATEKFEPKKKAVRRGRTRESEILQSSFNTVKLGSSSKKQQNKDKNTANTSMTTKSGRKISFIVDLKESKRQSRIRESQDRRRKEVKEKLKGQTNKKTKT